MTKPKTLREKEKKDYFKVTFHKPTSSIWCKRKGIGFRIYKEEIEVLKGFLLEEQQKEIDKMENIKEKSENILREGINIIEENSRLERKVKEQQKEIEKLVLEIETLRKFIEHKGIDIENYYLFKGIDLKELKQKLKKVRK